MVGSRFWHNDRGALQPRSGAAWSAQTSGPHCMGLWEARSSSTLQPKTELPCVGVVEPKRKPAPVRDPFGAVARDRQCGI